MFYSTFFMNDALLLLFFTVLITELNANLQYNIDPYVGQGLTIKKITITNVNIANTTVLITVLSSYDVICII